jgi:hypothetical protein
MGIRHSKCLIICKKTSKDGRFLVLNIPFSVQNNKCKDFFEILFSLTGFLEVKNTGVDLLRM